MFRVRDMSVGVTGGRVEGRERGGGSRRASCEWMYWDGKAIGAVLLYKFHGGARGTAWKSGWDSTPTWAQLCCANYSATC